jgi:hypothetical protein
MSAPRDVDRLLDAFLQEGPMELPDASYDQVRARIDQARQRAFLGPWRFSVMNNNIVRVGLAVAAVVVIAIIAINLLPGTNPPGSGGPSASPSVEAYEAPPSAEPTAASSAPPLTQSFTSSLHGISVSYPEGWSAEAATEPWTDSTFPLSFEEPHADWLYDPDLTSDLFLTLASQPIGDSTPEEWTAAQMASGEGCAATEPITVDGAAGLIGTADCNVVVVTAADRGYWIQLYTSGDDPSAVAAYDRAWFEEFLATVQLTPEDAVD